MMNLSPPCDRHQASSESLGSGKCRLRKVLKGSCSVGLLVVAFAAAAPAQLTGRAVINVRVSDSTGPSIPGAEASIVRGLAEVLAVGTTDSAGKTQLALASGASSLQLVVRRMGYRRADRFFSLSARDSASFSVVLSRVATNLATVRINTREDIKRKAYFVDADAIANSNRVRFSALDIAGKLRPDMTDGRGAAESATSGSMEDASAGFPLTIW
jgi:hypothetical protein